MNNQTATPNERLAAFRSDHRIQVEDGRCTVDELRVHPIKGGWRHDTSEAVRLISHVAHLTYDLFDAECRECCEPARDEMAGVVR